MLRHRSTSTTLLHVCFAAILLALGGCTSLKVNRLTDASSAKDREGITYYLPLKQLVVDTTFEITGCRAQASSVQLEYIVAAKVVDKQVPDLSERYSISYRALAALTKTTDLSVSTSEQGLLVSVNAAAADQTGPILSNIAGAAFSIARAAALAPIMTMDTPGQGKTPPDACAEFKSRTLAVETARAAWKKAVLKDEERQAAALARSKAAAALKVAEARLKEAEEAKEAAAIADARADVRSKRGSFEAAQQALADLGPLEAGQKANELAEARQMVSVTRTLLWTPDPSTFGAGGHPPIFIFPSAASLQGLGFSPDAAALAAGRLVAQVVASPLLGGIGADPGVSSLPEAGIVYRQPAHVLLRVCSGQCEEPVSGAVTADALAYSAVHAIPQLGIKASLPLSNWLFEDNALNISFGESGQPKVVTFKSKSSGERAASSAREIGDAYLGFVKGRETDRLELLKGRRADEEAQLALEGKRRDAQVDSLADRLEALKKLEALEAARTGVATRNQLSEEALEARKRQLLLLVQIKEQENKLKALSASPEQ